MALRMRTKVVWRGPQVMTSVEQAASRGVLKAANLLKNNIIKTVLESPAGGRVYGSHVASAPGEPPASDTGALVRSIRVDHKALKANVIVAAQYAALLEFGTQFIAPRPFVRPTVAKSRPAMVKVFNDEIGKALKK